MQRKHSYPVQPFTPVSQQPNKKMQFPPSMPNKVVYQTIQPNVQRSFISPNCQYSKISTINQPKNPKPITPQSSNFSNVNLTKSTIFTPQTGSSNFQQLPKKIQFRTQQPPFQFAHEKPKLQTRPSIHGEFERMKRSEIIQPNQIGSKRGIPQFVKQMTRDASPIYAAKEKSKKESKQIPKTNLSELLNQNHKNKLLQSMILQDTSTKHLSSDQFCLSKSTKHQVASTESSQNNRDSKFDGVNVKSPNKIKRPNIWPMTIQPLEKKSHDQEQLMFRKQKEAEEAQCEKNISEFQTKNRLSAPLPRREKKEFSLEDFDVVEKIGKGAYGDVFLAQEKKTNYLCVIKTISKNKIKQLKLQEHIFRQIKLQLYMNHRHLTPIFGFFHDENKIYLILQYMSDGNLSHVYRKKKVPEPVTSSLVRQTCDGLSYMHRENILHRDIKPQNLFIHQDYIKIGDFGCAVFSNTMRKTVVGCLAYISPEQLSNSDYDEKIDAWSLGILTYQLLTGRPPFEEDIIKIARNQKQRKLSQLIFPQNMNFSEDAVDFVKKLLMENPDDRMDLRSALKHPFITKHRQGQMNKLM